MQTNNRNIKNENVRDIRLIIPIFLLKKLKVHPLTKGLYPVSLGKSSFDANFQISQQNPICHSLLYCYSGGGILNFHHRSQKLNQGDLVLIPPNTNYKFIGAIQTVQGKHKNSINTLYWVNFEGELSRNFAERFLMKMDAGVAQVGIFKNVEQDFDELLALGQRGYTATNVIHAVHLLQQTLSFLALQLRVTYFNSSSKFDLDAVETLMRNNLHQELSLDTLAHYAQLSKFHFAKKFKELTDSSPIQHFINMKIQKACFELDNNDETIKQIAEQLGYNDPYYFSRLFKKVVGMSPKQYRNSRHNQ